MKVVDIVIMPLLLQPRSVNRVVALDQQKLFYSKVLYDQHNIMSKGGSFVNGSQEESHSYDNRSSEDEGN